MDALAAPEVLAIGVYPFDYRVSSQAQTWQGKPVIGVRTAGCKYTDGRSCR